MQVMAAVLAPSTCCAPSDGGESPVEQDAGGADASIAQSSDVVDARLVIACRNCTWQTSAASSANLRKLPISDGSAATPGLTIGSYAAGTRVDSAVAAIPMAVPAADGGGTGTDTNEAQA